jgi:hypothetical protein
MLINDKSILKDVLQSMAGTWDLSTDDGWKVIEQGKIRLFKKLLTKGSNVLPKKFLNNRKEVCPVMLFTKNGLAGQTLDLQQNAIDVQENCICVIIQF